MQRLPILHYELELSEQLGAPWRVVEIYVEEALDNPYRALVKAVADPSIEVDTAELDTLLGCDAVLRLIRRDQGEDRSTRTICGVVTRLDFLGHEGAQPVVRFHVAPAFALLRQRIDSRIFQDLGVQDIVGEVLGDALGELGRKHDVGDVGRGKRVRDYCTQFRESDFDFVSRLLEEEGIAYEFHHDDASGLETLVLHDGNTAYDALANLDGAAEIPCIETQPEQADVESIQSFEWLRRMTSTAVLRRDFDFTTPSELLTSPAEGKDARGRVRRVYLHGQRRFIDDDLAERAKDAHEAALSLDQRARGRSNVSAMRPGLRFSLTGHDRSDLLREYLIVDVVHFGADQHTSSSGSAEGGYHNEFECIPVDVVARPEPKTSKPSVRGPQTAIVTGAAGDEICTDEHGRIRVQFHWEEQGKYDDTSSCWVRCAQSWAGPSWGAQFIPRVGMEVVVEFLDGNPDRPLVTGCVYNGANPPPFALPDQKTQSGWRTNSSPGGGGSNELRFEDAAGGEEIYLHGQKDWTTKIENDKTETIGHDETNSIGNDHSESVGHDHSETVGNDHALTISHDQTITIANDQTASIGNDQTITVTCSQQATIGIDRTDIIGVNATETVGAVKTIVVGALFAQTVGGTMATIVGESLSFGVAGSHSLTVGDDASESIIGAKSVQAQSLTSTLKDDASVTTGKNFTLAVGQKLGATAKQAITIKGDDTATIEIAKKLVLKCGEASITMKSNGDVVIKGKNITIKASGKLVEQGSKIGQN